MSVQARLATSRSRNPVQRKTWKMSRSSGSQAAKNGFSSSGWYISTFFSMVLGQSPLFMMITANS